MPDASDPLHDADTNTLVLETGRRLERASLKLVPAGKDGSGKPLTLGPRIRAIKDQLGPEAWEAYQRWAKQRNAYTHAEISEIEDRDAFRQNFTIVERRLKQLSKPKRKPKAKPSTREGGNWLLVIVALLGLAVVYFSC